MHAVTLLLATVWSYELGFIAALNHACHQLSKIKIDAKQCILKVNSDIS